MKEKLKTSIFAVSIVYIIIISITMLLTVLNQTKTVTYQPITGYDKKLSTVKEEVNKLEEDACIKSIKSLIEFTEATYYTEEIKIKDLYDSMDSDGWWFGRNVNAFDNCDLTEEEKSEITSLIMASGIQFDELIQRHAYDYELKIFDSTRETFEPNMETIENNIRKNLEIKVIEKFIEVYNEK